MTRRAKIVATIGPSSRSREVLKKLIMAGLNVARVNMSHGTHADHIETIKTIRSVSEELGREIGILCDLQGPKIRVDKLDKNLILEEGQVWSIGQSDVINTNPDLEDRFIPTIYENLVKDCHVGARVLFDDGLLEAKVIDKTDDVIKIEVIIGGELKSNKGINLPDVKVSAPSFTDKDREDFYFGIENHVDYFALSFVRNAQEILDVKELLKEKKLSTPIIAKIEKPEAIENIEDIIRASDAIMVARGDLGVEVGNHLVPTLQKKIIQLSNHIGRPVITATQMLESMTNNSRPTRAEANDVANAIWDGTDAVMLSGETAAGDYPVETVTMMSQIILEAEKDPTPRPFLRAMDIQTDSACIQVAASIVAEKTHAKYILSITESGTSCLKMSHFRPKTPVLGVTNSVHVMRKISLYWGITAYYFAEDGTDLSSLQWEMTEQLKQDGKVKDGDKVVITHGAGRFFSQGSANSIRLETITDFV